ncbi:MAG: hypothetical protein WC464_04445 [Bdellovibrionales bacterium]
MTDPISNYFSGNISDVNIACLSQINNIKNILTHVTEKLRLDPENDVVLVGSQARWNDLRLPIVQYSLKNKSTLVVSPIIINFNQYIFAVSVNSVGLLTVQDLEAIELRAYIGRPHDYENFPEGGAFNPYPKNPQKFSTHIASVSQLEKFLNLFNKANQARPAPKRAVRNVKREP